MTDDRVLPVRLISEQTRINYLLFNFQRSSLSLNQNIDLGGLDKLVSCHLSRLSFRSRAGLGARPRAKRRPPALRGRAGCAGGVGNRARSLPRSLALPSPSFFFPPCFSRQSVENTLWSVRNIGLVRGSLYVNTVFKKKENHTLPLSLTHTHTHPRKGPPHAGN